MHVVQEENNIEKKIEFSLHVYKTNMKCNINNLRDNTTGKNGRVKHLAYLSVLLWTKRIKKSYFKDFFIEIR